MTLKSCFYQNERDLYSIVVEGFENDVTCYK